MNDQEVIDAVNALNDPNGAMGNDGGMVYQVFEDGEITLQKGGSLMWQRTLHCVVPGVQSKALPADALCHKMRSAPHSYIFAASKEVADRARLLIVNRD